jgi:transposase/biotin operon repressor
MYVERQMTAAEIGDELGCSKGAVLDQLDRNGIEARGFGEQPKWIDAPWRDESMLRELYVDEGLPMETIAARLDCSSTAVRLGLIRHGIDRRTHAETTIGQLPDALTDAERMHEWYVTERMTGPEIADRLDKPLTTVLRWLERHEIDRRGHDARIADELQDEELMHRLYVGERLSLNKIGERYGHADSTVRRWLQIHEIDTSTGLIQSGQDNPNWRGGSSVLEAVRTLIGDLSWNSISQRTRAAASDECEMCGDTPAKRGCDVHHIVPIMAGGDNGDYNLMVLCRRCHATVEHYTREYFDPVLVE